jgi:hypothetical protein
VSSYQYKKSKEIISGMCRQKFIYKKREKNQIVIYRLINIANEIVNKRRIKLSGCIELAIAIRHLS